MITFSKGVQHKSNLSSFQSLALGLILYCIMIAVMHRDLYACHSRLKMILIDVSDFDQVMYCMSYVIAHGSNLSV